MTEIAEIIRKAEAAKTVEQLNTWEMKRKIDAVIMIVSDVFIVDEAELINLKNNHHFVTEARYAVYTLLNEMVPMSKRSVAKSFGREHQGINYGIDCCKKKRREKLHYAENYKTCERLLKDIL